MYISKINTKLSPMVAIADEYKLYLLEFIGRPHLDHEIEQIKFKTKLDIRPGKTKPIDLIEQELNEYFEGKLKEFKTPICLGGTTFQQSVWKELQKIPYGETRSYANIANSIGKPTASRAIGNANGSNQLAIIIPCHRVINSNGNLGGYAGGLEYKKWLLNFEKT